MDVDPNTEKVEAYSNLVISRKASGKLRMNVDARPINTSTAEIVSPHMTTPEDVRHRLAGSTRFSEFDMNHGYHQSTLSEDSSRKYGVFQSHEGFHRFTGLYFGHTQATQAFNEDVGNQGREKPLGKGTLRISPLRKVDFYAFWAYLFLYLLFNCIYWNQY